MSPLQHFAQFLLKLGSASHIDQSEWEAARHYYEESHSLIQGDAFVSIVKAIYGDLDSQPKLKALAAEWKQRFEDFGGALPEEMAQEYLFQNYACTDMRRILSSPVFATRTCIRGNETYDYAAEQLARHSGWTLIVTLAGTGCIATTDTHFLAQAGDLVLFGPNGIYDYHHAPETQEWLYIFIHFHLPPEWETWLNWPLVGQQVHHVKISDTDTVQQLHNICEEVLGYSLITENLSQQLGLNLIEQVLLRAGQLVEQTPTSQRDPRVKRARDFISLHYVEPITADAIADYAHASKSHLSKIFRQEVGVSLLAWRDKLRMIKACQLLRETNNPVASIGNQIGYEDAAFFNRVFRRSTGVSPRAYRQQLTQGDIDSPQTAAARTY